MSDSTELAKHTLHTMYDAQSIVGRGYLSIPEVSTLVRADIGKVEAALAELVAGGFVEENDEHEFRARGTVATPGPEEKAMAQHPAAGAQRAERNRHEALAYAVAHATDSGSTAADIVSDAAKFEAYLNGEGGPLDKHQIAQVRDALKDADDTLSLIDAPETTQSIRAAIKFLGSFLA